MKEDECMKENFLKIILLFIILFTFYIIFQFSGQDGKKSQNVSRKISEILVNMIHNTKNMTKYEKNKLINSYQPIVRKSAHFSIYMVLGFFIMIYMNIIKCNYKIKLIVTMLIGTSYAISDEIHQMFIPERTAKVFDVIIDTFGIFIGIYISNIIIKIYKKCVSK